MARPARLAGPAQRWLSAEVRYLASHNPAAATALLDRIEAVRLRLSTYPETGPKTRLHGMRRIVVAPYVLTYRIDGSDVQILSIRHGQQSDPAGANPPLSSSEEES